MFAPMYPVAVSLILLIFLLGFAYTAYRRGVLFAVAQGRDNRFDNIPNRVKAVIKFAIGQRRFMRHDVLSGFMHALIFWGFLVISLRTITFFGMGYDADFVLPGMAGALGRFYNITLNIFLILVVVACCYMLYRRTFAKPKRLTLGTEGYVILLVIILLCVSDFTFEAARFARGEHVEKGAFIGPWLAAYLGGLSPLGLEWLKGASYFIHIISILGFLNFLPYGKHFHIITAIPNVFFYKTRPYGELTKLDLTDASATTFGNDHIEQFTWKNYLDWFSCTECGRCTAQCPATNSDKPLNPKLLTVYLRDFLYAKNDKLMAKQQGRYNGPLDDKGYIPDKKGLLDPNVFDHNILWSCTSCRACEEACPVFIEYVQEIVDMRRHLVLMEGNFPTEVQNVFQNMERNANPWGISFHDRANWAKELDIPTMDTHPDVEYLYFVGCAGSFDERNKKVATAFAKLLKKAGIKFGILGVEEKCNGDSARRIGNEYLAQQLMQENIATFEKYKVKKVITSCPHCFNIIKNEYPQFKGHYEVIHHTEFLNQLIRDGILKPTRPVKHVTTYHDSCYLGRYNDNYDHPREILKSIPGVTLKEMENSRDIGRCCGAGGGRMWMEETIGRRINHMRLEDVQATDAKMVATACPFCKIMLSDAINDKNAAGYEARDVVELLWESVE